MNSETLEHLRSLLAELLSQHGHTPTRHENWLLPQGGLPAIGAAFYRDQAWHPSVWQVDFQIVVGKDAVITESFAVTGENGSELALDALQKFSANSLHVVLAALCGDSSAARHVETIEWTSANNSRWRAYLSGWRVTTYEGVASTPPPAVFDGLEPLIKGRLVDTNIHWFRVLLSTAGGARTVEVLWDNETWQEAEESARALDWAGDNQQTMRCFAIVLPR